MLNVYYIRIVGYLLSRKMRAASMDEVRRQMHALDGTLPSDVTRQDTKADDKRLIRGKLYYTWARELTDQGSAAND